MSMQIGSLRQVAHPLLSWFVISCCIAITMILYVMQKTEAVASAFTGPTTLSQGDY
jgi:hypothetical protein